MGMSRCPCNRNSAFQSFGHEQKIECRVGHAFKRRDVGRVHGLHANIVVAGIHMQHFTSHGTGQIRKQIQCGFPDFINCDRALQWSVVFVPFEDVPEITDSRRSKGS